MTQTQVKVLGMHEESFLHQGFALKCDSIRLLWWDTVCSIGTLTCPQLYKNRPFFSQQLSFNISTDFLQEAISSHRFQSEVVSHPQSRENSEITETLTRQLHTVIYFLTYYTFSTHFSNHNHSTTYIYTSIWKPTHFCPREELRVCLFQGQRSYSNTRYDMKVGLWSQLKPWSFLVS